MAWLFGVFTMPFTLSYIGDKINEYIKPVSDIEFERDEVFQIILKKLINKLSSNSINIRI
jgi:hypothetical protein